MSEDVTVTGIDSDKLRSIIDRIVKLNEEIQAIKDDQKEIFGSAKAEGYDVKLIRKCISILGQDENKRRDENTMLEVYLTALGIEL